LGKKSRPLVSTASIILTKELHGHSWFVEQQGTDDSLPAAMASVMRVSLEKLPGLTRDTALGLARANGYELLQVENWPAILPWGYHVAIGPSPRETSHAVVCLNGIIVHDPHPSKAGIFWIDSWLLLFPRAVCPACNDEGVVCNYQGDVLGPCDCA
jgi:hypothetical protein